MEDKEQITPLEELHNKLEELARALDHFDEVCEKIGTLYKDF